MRGSIAGGGVRSASAYSTATGGGAKDAASRGAWKRITSHH